jgi:hypothetical protein
MKIFLHERNRDIMRMRNFCIFYDNKPKTDVMDVGSAVFLKKIGTRSDITFGRRGEVLYLPMPGKKFPKHRCRLRLSENTSVSMFRDIPSQKIPWM